MVKNKVSKFSKNNKTFYQKKVNKFSLKNIFLALISIIIIIYLFTLLFQNWKVITGKAVYYNPLTLEQLKNGIKLDTGINNLFYWPKEFSGNIKIIEVIKNIQSSVYYVYDYNDRKYWFNPNEKYGKYATNPLYRNKLTDVFKPGHKIRINVKENIILKYGFIDCNNAIETDGGNLNNIFGEILRYDNRGYKIVLAKDECVDSKVLRESICSSENNLKKVIYENIECPGKCNNGKCANIIKGDINNDDYVDYRDIDSLKNMITQGNYVKEADIDKDGWLDGYDVYRLELIIQRTDINPYPIREFLLKSDNSIQNTMDNVLGELSEISAGRATTWTIEHEKKGETRGVCNPPVMKVNLKDVSMNDRLIGLSNNGRSQLRYDEFRMVSSCNIWGGRVAESDNLIREYFAYFLLRDFGVPAVDTIAFAKVKFDTPISDNIPKDTFYNYIFLQRHNSYKDQIPFMNQFGFSRIIDSKSDMYYYYGGNFLSLNAKKNNIVEKLEMDPETAIKYFYLTRFLGDYDHPRFRNEDYGLDSISNKWKYIPYDFDFSFSCHPLLVNYNDQNENIIISSQGAKIYEILRNIFDNPSNLYSMLKAIDKYPFDEDKIKMKNDIKLRFYYFALYYGSREFADKLNVEYEPFVSQELYLNEVKKILYNQINFPVYCHYSSRTINRYNELRGLLQNNYNYFCNDGICKEIICNDNIDNDKDGLIDCGDNDCNTREFCFESICNDNIDNDKDEKIDCRDNDCKDNDNCITCEDSDGGKNYFVKGNAIDSRGNGGVDKCEDWGIDKGKLIESYCDGKIYRNETVYCPIGNECKDGVCIAKEPSCVDSDGGNNINVKGTVSYTSLLGKRSVTDYCIGTKLLEYYCKNNQFAFSYQNCPSKICSNGTCIVN